MDGERPAATMQDVARRAGVSKQTVSNVVNGRSARVGDETRGRVLAAIDELGYRVNQSARSLRRGRTGMVGLAVPTLANEYYGDFCERLSRAFAEHGLRLVIEITGGELESELHSLASSRLDHYDGFVLTMAAIEADHLASLATSVPVVLTGERAHDSAFDHVLMDNVRASRAATELLLERGSRRLVVLGGAPRSEASTAGLRTAGSLEALAARGLPRRDALVVATDFTMESGYAQTRRLIDEGVAFDGVFAVTDSIALGALRALLEAGVRVPRDVQLAGFDNTRVGAMASPSLTSVEPGHDAIARAIATLLVERMNRAEPGPPRVVMPEASLVERESTRPASTRGR
ncbi:LacI family DNA-binding transcriptional regulator [Agromyces soli]